MESNPELKETVIKNSMCYYFHDIIKIENVHSDNVLKIR